MSLRGIAGRAGQVLAIVAVAGLAACATRAAPAAGPPSALQGAWSFDFDAGPGVASAVFADPAGDKLLLISCQSPRGPVVITDWINGADIRNVGTARLSIAGVSHAANSGQLQPDGDPPVIRFSIAPAATVFQAITPSAPVMISYNGKPPTTLPAGAAVQINSVLNACITRGS